MPSQLQDVNLADIDWASLSREQLIDIRDNDDRETARQSARDTIRDQDTPPRLDPEEYNPRTDPGPERYEDRNAVVDETPVDDYPEVTDEQARRDETTVLATDLVVVDDDNKVEIIPLKD